MRYSVFAVVDIGGKTAVLFSSSSCLSFFHRISLVDSALESSSRLRKRKRERERGRGRRGRARA
jgi:hypothetical protein